VSVLTLVAARVGGAVFTAVFVVGVVFDVVLLLRERAGNFWLYSRGDVVVILSCGVRTF
jgi:hypothetical protein